MKNIKNYFNNIDKEIDFYIGKNAKDNFDVIDKGSDNDLWFHSDTLSSCHVVAIIPPKCNKKHIQSIIKYGAILCKNHTSKLRSENNVSIIYTHIKNIQKIDVIGCVNIHDIKSIKKIVV